MKTGTLILCIVCFVVYNGLSQVNMEVGVFRDNKANAYLELFLKLDRELLDYEEMIGMKYKTSLPAAVSLYREDELLFSDSFEINSPILNYPRDLFFNRQYNTPESGEFSLRFDCQTTQGPISTERQLVIHPPEHAMSLSSSLLLANYGKTDQLNAAMVKGGYHLTLLNGKNRRNQKKIAIYTEVYVHRETSKHKKFVQVSVFDANENFMKSQVYHVNASYSSAYVFEMETSDLKSGQYGIQVELKSFPKGAVYDSRKLDFYRDNPYLSSPKDSLVHNLQEEFVSQLEEAELDYCLRAVVPIVPQVFSDRWAKTARKGTVEEKRALLLEYYVFLDHNNYFREFLNYMEKVEFCNEQFDSGFGYGFESDRGVIYLKYGPPNDQFHQEHESTAPPYEIWTYNQLEETKQTNVKFIFHNPSLAPGNYVLLHSNARGELYNPRWKLDLYKNSPWDQMSNDINETEVRRQFTRRAGRNFTDF